MRSLIEKALELEKKYEWLQAAESYNEAILALEETTLLRKAEFQEKMGFCFFRAALQAQSIEKNTNRIKLAIKTYQKAIKSIESLSDTPTKARMNKFKAWVLFLESWLQTNLLKKKTLIVKWLSLLTQNLSILEKLDDPLSVAETCNSILEFSAVDRFFITTDSSETKEIIEECIQLGEKAIKLLSNKNNTFELARAYCWTSWFYGIGLRFWQVFEDKKEEIGEKSLGYSKKALDFSQKTGDAWLIGWSNSAASSILIGYKGDLDLSLQYNEVFVKQGRLAEDNYMLSTALIEKANCIYLQTTTIEDPEKQRDGFKKVLKCNENSKKFADLSNYIPIRLVSRNSINGDLYNLSSLETKLEVKIVLFKKIISNSKKTLQLASDWLFPPIIWTFAFLSSALFRLSELLTDTNQKQRNLKDALNYRKNAIRFHERFRNFQYYERSFEFKEKAKIQIALAELEETKEKKCTLDAAELSIETCLDLLKKSSLDLTKDWRIFERGNYYFEVGGLLYQLTLLIKKDASASRAIEFYDKAIVDYLKTGHYSNLAESYWKKARIQDYLSEETISARNYSQAAEAYLKASKKIPKLKDFYENHSQYMQAWSDIEQAKYIHSRGNYLQAMSKYESAGKLHEKLDDWNYLSSNYFAWAKIEQAEEYSRTERPKEAMVHFNDAIEFFQKTENSINSKLKENIATEERDSITRILKSSDLRRRYCQARILMEEAKLLDKKGSYIDSSRSYGKAAQSLSAIIGSIEAESERDELRYVAILCEAWEKMALAEERASADSYLEAARLFEQAKERCYTKKASLWALGNSNFCKGLAAGVEYQTSLNVDDHNRAKGYIQNAATNYFRAGYRNASEYAKGTLRLFDAYLFMNEAERESDTEKRVKLYQLAESLLQLASSSFVGAKQPEKTVQVKQILGNVREEKKLAISFNDVLQAPSIASTTQSFTAPSPTSEASVGLEQFQHANVQANLIAGLKEVKVGESFCLSVEFVNAGKEPALLTRVDDFVPPDFIVVKKPEIYRIEESCLNMKGKQIAPLKLVEAKLVLQPSKKGVYHLSPVVHYLDELGQNKFLQLKSVEIKVEEVVLADRVSTGTGELDSLLLGGIPNEYAVVLTGSPSDERELLIRNFLKAGTEQGQTSFYVTTEAEGAEKLIEKPGFRLFLCNPKPKTEVPDLPNVTKLRSKTDINNLNMALARESRNLQTEQNPKRLCVEIVSDVLLRLGPEVTRRWLSELITDLGGKGFTVLAVMNPGMHPVDQATAVVDLFDGEISITQSNDSQECKKSIQVKKLRGQDYIKNPICLTKS